MKIYIKFRHPEDVYAIDFGFNQEQLPIRCPRCGDTRYVEVDLEESYVINQPLPDLIRPLPKENPHLVYLSEPEPMTLEFTKELNYAEQYRLKWYPSMSYVGSEGFSLLIDGVSREPVPHVCYEIKSYSNDCGG